MRKERNLNDLRNNYTLELKNRLVLRIILLYSGYNLIYYTAYYIDTKYNGYTHNRSIYVLIYI